MQRGKDASWKDIQLVAGVKVESTLWSVERGAWTVERGPWSVDRGGCHADASLTSDMELYDPIGEAESLVMMLPTVPTDLPT